MLYNTRKANSDEIEILTEKNKQLEKSLEEEKRAAVLGRKSNEEERIKALEEKLAASEVEMDKLKGLKDLV
jgi:hypothetical protein